MAKKYKFTAGVPNSRRTKGTNATKVAQAEAVSEMGVSDLHNEKLPVEAFHKQIGEKKSKKTKK